MRDPLASIRRTLEKRELEHLREYVAELANRLESAERDRDHYRDQADMWWQSHMNLLDQLHGDGAEIGVDKSGHLHVITPPDAA